MDDKEIELAGLVGQENEQEPTLNHGTACEQILEWFDHYVHENNISIGDLLPSEDHIVQATRMSRTSVREALTRLRAFGVIESRRKRGMRLMRSPQLLEFINLLDHSTVTPELVLQMGNFRGALEAGMEPEIIRNASDGEIAELSRIYEQMVQNEEKIEVWFSLDLSFHEMLITMSKNKVSIWMTLLLRPYYERLRSHIVPGSERTRENYRRIVQALVNRDPVMFHHVLHEYLLETLVNMQREMRSLTSQEAMAPATKHV